METFDATRTWATVGGDGGGTLVLQHKVDGGSLETWRMACIGAAERFTADHHANYHQGAEPWPVAAF